MVITTTNLIIFAMEAAIRLGSKIVDVYQDDIRDKAIIFPLAQSVGPVSFERALGFFETQGRHFVDEGGLYEDLWNRVKNNSTPEVREELRKAAARMSGLLEEAQSRAPKNVDEQIFYREIAGYYAIAQWKIGDPRQENSPLQRIAGTILEIGLDYVKTDSSFLDGEARSQKLVRSILLALEPIEFAEQKVDAIFIDLFKSSMAVFYDNADIFIEDEKLTLLLKEISKTLRDEIEAVKDDTTLLIMLQEFGRNSLQGIIQASARVVMDNTEFFLGTPHSDEKQFVTGVLKAVLSTFKTQPKLFSKGILVELYRSALMAVGDNSGLLLDNGKREQFLIHLFSSLAQELAEHNPSKLFTPDMLKEILGIALETTSHHVYVLVDPENPQKQLLADTLKYILLAFSDDFTQDQSFSDTASGLLSRDILLQILRLVFNEVSKNPEALLWTVDDEDQKAILTQIIGSMTAVIASEPKLLLYGEDLITLLEIAFHMFSKNPDRLIDLTEASPKTNILYKVMAEVLESVRENREQGGRNLLNGQWLLMSLEIALSVVSKNTNAYREKEGIVKMSLDRLLQLASGSLANELDAENLVAIFWPVLAHILKDNAILDDEKKFNNFVEMKIADLI